MKAVKSRDISLAETLEPMPATTLRRDWSTAKELLRANGVLALTSHGSVQAVLLEPAGYEALVARAEAADKALIEGLADRFDRRLAALEQPNAAERLRAAFAREGHFDNAPVAGDGF